MKVYAMNVSSIKPDGKTWYKCLSDRRIQKVERLKKIENKAQSIGAELLLNFAVNGDIRKNVAWDTDESGKLYLTENNGFYVNLSHSGEWAVCAAHSAPVGVDIQYWGECDMKVAERFFTDEENRFVRESKDRNSAFYEIWTKKESFVKAVGKGLAIPLKSFSVLGDFVIYDGGVYKFKQYSISDSRYKLFVCYLS